MTSLEAQLRASLPLTKQIQELRKENALLKAQLRVANLREERRVRESADLPALLRCQAE